MRAGILSFLTFHSYTVPEFTADEDVRARYRSVARELIGAAIARAVNDVRQEYAILRQQFTRAARQAEAAQLAADTAAHLARAKYAKIVPKQRTASGIVKPPTFFFDILMSMGAANTYYAEALETAQRKREAAEAARMAFAELERLKSKADAAVVVRELDVRRYYKTENGRSELDADSRLHDIALQCAAIENERNDFKKRVEAGEVSDEELRDRAMAEEGTRYLDGDRAGLHCLRERDVRFGMLRYFTFRDRDGHIWLLDYSDDLRLLMHTTFDVVQTHDRYVISRSASDGTHHTNRSAGPLAGPDPRAANGVAPTLMRAIVDFVARERMTL